MVRKVSLRSLTTFFAFHLTCVRFQWHIKRLYLHYTGVAGGFSDRSNDFICITRDLREVSVTGQTNLLAFHGTCVRLQWHIKRLYLHYTGLAWGFSDRSNEFISIPRDLREVTVTYQTTLFAFLASYFAGRIFAMVPRETKRLECSTSLNSTFICI